MEPKARHDQILVDHVLDETIVYDLRLHKAHRMNSTAAAIWRRCDGKTTMAEIAASLPELGLPADAELVRYALTRLEQAHLLDEAVTPLPGEPSVSRREMLSKLTRGGVVALLLPVVTSITAPTPAMAASKPCVKSGKKCGSIDQTSGDCVVEAHCCFGPCIPGPSLNSPCVC
jgi:hypothetical protein